jgi:type I restriction enzyme R subunit
MCKRIMKAETSMEGDVPFFKIGTFGRIPDAYISRKTYEEYKSKYSYPKKGDILISASGTIGRTVIYQSVYIDLYQEYRPKGDADKENINDDIIFEIELIRQIEVNIDYILMLVAKYKESNCEDKNILVTIDKAINSSIELRSKKELIERFIEQVNTSTQVDEDWRKFINERREADIVAIIEEEKLKPEETRRFIDNAFRDGALKTTGTAVDKIMPPVSRFGGKRALKKQGVMEKLRKFFEKYFGLV